MDNIGPDLLPRRVVYGGWLSVLIVSTLSALILVNSVQPAWSQTVSVDVSISAASQPSAIGGVESTHGYLEYRVSLRNLANEKRRVRVLLPLHGYRSSGNTLESSERSLVLEPRAEVSVSIFQPALPISGGSLGVQVGSEGPMQVANLQGQHSSRGHSSGGDPCILISKTIQGRSRSEFNREISEYFQSEASVDLWSTRWLGYSRFDGVALAAADLERMPATVRQALFRYIECGGAMLVMGAWTPPAHWKRSDARSGLEAYYQGFGYCAVWPQPDFSRVAVNIFEAEARRSSMPWRRLPDLQSANRKFQIVVDMKIPSKGLIGILILFALIIGPVNIVLLGRRRRKMWLLVTIPAISLICCAAIWVYWVVDEGWNGIERTESITILDESSKSAATVGVSAFYSPLTPSDGLHYSLQTEVSAWVERGYSRGGRPRTLNWDRDQHLESGWMTARVPAHFQLRKADTVRERVAVTIEPDGTVSIVNGLAHDLRKVYVCDDNLAIHRAERVPAGKQVVLQKQSSRGVGKPNSLRNLYVVQPWVESKKSQSTLSKPLHEVLSKPEFYLQAGTYIAELEATPFLESGMEGATRRSLRSVVYGFYVR